MVFIFAWINTYEAWETMGQPEKVAIEPGAGHFRVLLCRTITTFQAANWAKLFRPKRLKWISADIWPIFYPPVKNKEPSEIRVSARLRTLTDCVQACFTWLLSWTWLRWWLSNNLLFGVFESTTWLNFLNVWSGGWPRYQNLAFKPILSPTSREHSTVSWVRIKDQLNAFAISCRIWTPNSLPVHRIYFPAQIFFA